jgi:uncharacterized damage-inducible protein DinB
MRMNVDNPYLANVFAGWEDHQTSLLDAIRPLTAEQLAFRPAAGLRSVGELAAHISIGRFEWFARMGAPGSAVLAEQIAAVDTIAAVEGSAEALVRWLEATWGMVAQTLKEWTVADLEETYRHPYQGQVYAISRQWTVSWPTTCITAGSWPSCWACKASPSRSWAISAAT